MITTRSGFAEAIRNKQQQRALVTFPALPVCFTNEDIAVNGGIKLEEILNGDENLVMGRAVMSEVSVALINSSNYLLQSVDFTGEFDVMLGVSLGRKLHGSTINEDTDLCVLVGDDDNILQIEASTSSTSIYANGVSYSAYGNPRSLIVYQNTLYVFALRGVLLCAYAINGNTLTQVATPTLNAFMKSKATSWAAYKKCAYLGSDGTMRESTVYTYSKQVYYDLYQYVPLGHFIGNKPDRVKTQIVNLTGYDLMQRFEVPANGYFDTLTYPATLADMFSALCAYCGVEVGDISAALNMTKSFDAAPIDNDTSTCREVLAYIAEAAGCYARMSRDGKCELVWYSDVDYTVAKTDYFDINVAEYSVQQIDKLQSHVSQEDVGVIVGEGTNCYDIVDNPYLNGATDAEIRPWVENIYNRLSAFSEYSPVNVSCEGNWALQCGDIVSVVASNGTTQQMPVFAQTITWAGNARATLECTGEQTRGVMSAVNREKIVNGRNYMNLTKTVEGLSVEVGKKVSQDDFDGLEESVANLELTSENFSLELSKKVTQTEVDESIENIDEFHNTSVDITAEGARFKTSGSIRFEVDDAERMVIDEEGVNAPLIVAEEIHAGNAVLKNLSSVIEWKGGIQASLDAAPKWLTQNTVLMIPFGTYQENVTVAGFKCAKLTLSFANGVTLLGTLTVRDCDNVSVEAALLGQGKIYPLTAVTNVVYVTDTGTFQLFNMQISGYRGRTTSSNGTTTGVNIERSRAVIIGCCVEYTSTYAILCYLAVMCVVQNCLGGQSGTDPTTNANLMYGVYLATGCHGSVYGTMPMAGITYLGQFSSTLLGAEDTSPTAGGMEYVAPTEFTKTFTLTKHCTYVYGVSRVRDDQNTRFMQGRYGTYSSGENNWRIGAMWFGDAASELSGRTIKSATLTLRRATGGWSSAVPVYLGSVALNESDFTSTLKPAFTASSTQYPGASLSRETEGTYDVTELMTAVQNGYALAVYEPPAYYVSGENWSPAYTQFYGKGSGFEPVLTVTYK